MAEFTPITTQEDFDKAIGERLKRERETVKKNMPDICRQRMRKRNMKAISHRQQKKKSIKAT